MPTSTATTTVGLETAWMNLMDFLPKALAFVVTLAVGWFVATFIGNLITKGLRKAGFDRIVERGGIRQALASGGLDAAELVGKLAFFTMFLFVLQLGFGFFGPNPISQLLTRMIAFLPNVFVALAIVVLGAYIASFVKQIIFAALGGLSYGKTLSTIASGAIMVVAIFAALNQLSIAPEIVNGLYYAVLAIIVGSSVIAIGGGGIQPMRVQWEKAMQKVEQEAPRLQAHLADSPERVRVVREGPYTA
jgi:hypothetical protein